MPGIGIRKWASFTSSTSRTKFRNGPSCEFSRKTRRRWYPNRPEVSKRLIRLRAIIKRGGVALYVDHRRAVLGIQLNNVHYSIATGLIHTHGQDAGHGCRDEIGPILTAGGENPAYGIGRVVSRMQPQLVAGIDGPVQRKQRQDTCLRVPDPSAHPHTPGTR